MFKNMQPEHKQHVLAALDHIDGILGDAMHNMRKTIAPGPGEPGKHPAFDGKEGSPKEEAGESPAVEAGENEQYEGKGNPGGHAGHSFGGDPDQHGEKNFHFGKRKNSGGLDGLFARISKK